MSLVSHENDPNGEIFIDKLINRNIQEHIG